MFPQPATWDLPVAASLYDWANHIGTGEQYACVAGPIACGPSVYEPRTCHPWIAAHPGVPAHVPFLQPGYVKSVRPMLMHPLPYAAPMMNLAWASPATIHFSSPKRSLPPGPGQSTYPPKIEQRRHPRASVPKALVKAEQVKQDDVLDKVMPQQAAEPVQAEAPGSGVSAPQGWSSLVSGVLQLVFRFIRDSDVKSFRLVCKHWRLSADQAVERLKPSLLKSKGMVTLFPRLQVLQLIQCPNIRNRDLYVLAQSNLSLKVLTIGDDTNKPWVTNRGLANIAQISSLRCLSLHDCNSVTNNGLSALNRLKQLSSLSLKGCKKITNAGLEALQHNAALTSLNLYGCIRVSDKGLAPLMHLPLVALHLGLTKIKDEGLGYIAKLTGLRELNCTKEEVTDAGVSLLRTLNNLESLALRNCCGTTGDAIVSLIPCLPKLQMLDVFKNYEFGDEQLASCMPYLDHVTALDLRGTWVKEDGIAQLARLTKLCRLSVSPQLDVWSDSLCVLSVLTQLTALTVSCCGELSAKFMQSLRNLRSLRELNLCDDVAPEDLAARDPMQLQIIEGLLKLTSLTALDLSRRRVRIEHLELLACNLPNLISMVLPHTPSAPHDFHWLETMCPRINFFRRVQQGDSSHVIGSSYRHPWEMI